MILSKGLWILRDLSRQTATRVGLYSGLAILSASLSPQISAFLPADLSDLMSEESTVDLLAILINSMLSVTIFSLSVMVAAHQFAASQATPRSHRLLREDGRTQRVLATFLGAFVFALTSRIAVDLGAYNSEDYVVLYGITILVTLAVVVALIRWVQRLSALGSIEKTTSRVEEAAREAVEIMMDRPRLGCRALPEDAGPGCDTEGEVVESSTFGYVRHIDVEGLSQKMGDRGEVDILIFPGQWVEPGVPVFRVRNIEGSCEDLLDRLVIGDLRSFDQDPIFGLQVISEIAQRALSPSVNDPQTAVDIVRRQSRLLHKWDQSKVDDPLPGLRMRATPADRAVAAAFDFIARDGSAYVEVQSEIQHALARLAKHEDANMSSAAVATSKRALKRSDAGLCLEEERATVHAAAPA